MGKTSGKQAKNRKNADDEEELEDEEMESTRTQTTTQSQPAELSASFKNFRHHPDMENFYRFIFENDLRLEALEMLNERLTQKQAKKKK
jgi:hypothetical protein